MPIAEFTARLRQRRSFLLLAAVILVADQWTKWLVETRLVGRPVVEVIPGLLNLTHVRNTGVAFGLFPAQGSLAAIVVLTLLGLLGFGLLLGYFLRTPPTDRLLLTSLSLVLGGAVGNLADRIATGSVTDFVDFYWGSSHWYTFNIADSAITCGVLLMGLEVLRPRRERPVEGGRTVGSAGAP